MAYLRNGGNLMHDGQSEPRVCRELQVLCLRPEPYHSPRPCDAQSLFAQGQ
jgi:hypothetical protein